MDVSVLVYKNHQNTDMEGFDLQLIVYLIHHHRPDKLVNEYWPTIFVRNILFIIFLSWLRTCNPCNPVKFIWLVGENTSIYSVQFGCCEWRLLLFNFELKTQSVKISGRAIARMLASFRTIKVSDICFYLLGSISLVEASK